MAEPSSLLAYLGHTASPGAAGPRRCSPSSPLRKAFQAGSCRFSEDQTKKREKQGDLQLQAGKALFSLLHAARCLGVLLQCERLAPNAGAAYLSRAPTAWALPPPSAPLLCVPSERTRPVNKQWGRQGFSGGGWAMGETSLMSSIWNSLFPLHCSPPPPPMRLCLARNCWACRQLADACRRLDVRACTVRHWKSRRAVDDFVAESRRWLGEQGRGTRPSQHRNSDNFLLGVLGQWMILRVLTVSSGYFRRR